MPTRKELLEDLRNEIAGLSGTVRDNSEDVRQSSQALADHGRSQIQAAEALAGGLVTASGTILAVAVFGGLLGCVGKALGDRIREINMKTDLIKSIQSLQGRHGPLTYEFVLERSFAQNASKEERQNTLNELIHDGIVSCSNSANGEVLSIAADNPKLKAYYDWLDSLKEIGKS